SGHGGHQGLVGGGVAHGHVKPVVGRQFQRRVETGGELDVAGNHRRRNRRPKSRVGKVVEFSQVRRIGSCAAEKVGGGRFGQVDESERQLKGEGLAGVCANGDVAQPEVKRETEIVAARQDGVQRSG